MEFPHAYVAQQFPRWWRVAVIHICQWILITPGMSEKVLEFHLPHIFSQVGMRTPVCVPKPPGTWPPPLWILWYTLYKNRFTLAAGPSLAFDRRVPSRDSEDDDRAVIRLGMRQLHLLSTVEDDIPLTNAGSSLLPTAAAGSCIFVPNMLHDLQI